MGLVPVVLILPWKEGAERPQTPVSERCSAQDTSTRRTCKVKYKRMPVKTRGRELKEERGEDPSKSKWVLFHE